VVVSSDKNTPTIAYKFLWTNLLKQLLRRPRRRCGGNIKIDLSGISYEDGR
jgi:hypothetical protein